ncbi:uncharacterized protein UHOD_00655 [Ustilago sp. UG-2017b]|nr:uncharacterized protein UHOD_00655 [Ustilago sp. UG-2017b]
MASASTSSYRLAARLQLRSSQPRALLSRTPSRILSFSALASCSRTPLSTIRHASSSSQPNKPGKGPRSQDGWSRHRAQYNYDPFTLHPEEKHYTYPLVTADDLAARSSSSSRTDAKPAPQIANGPGGRPREVRMLARDFIHDSLYNPNYGYFTKQAVLLPDPSPPSTTTTTTTSSSSSASATTEEGVVKEVAGQLYTQEMGLLRPSNPGFDFNSIKNESEFMRLLEERYHLFEEQISILVQNHANATGAAKKERELQESLQNERRERRQQRKKQEEGKVEKVAEYSAAGLEAAQRRGRAMARSGEGVQESDVQSMAAKQVWHTPTQIFQPYYAHALARYLIAEYKLHNYPYDDLVIYELGAGSGALARGILDYLQEHEPEVYTRIRYRIIEISPRLAEEQKRKLSPHLGRVAVENRDVLAWDGGVVQEPCFVIALEVFDNLAHDVVRFGTEDMRPYQAVVSIDDTGDMHELFEPLQDLLIKRYLNIIGAGTLPYASLGNSWTRFVPDGVRSVIAKHAPFFPNLTDPVFIPTNALRLIEKLKTHFPSHRIIMSDFDSLPDSLAGINAPVVQTRYKGAMIPVTTYLVLQGFFDIFFPTNFEHLKKTYKAVLNDSAGRGGEGEFFSSHFNPSASRAGGGRERNLKVYSHAEFLERYAETEKLQLRDGSNPLLSWYANASWFLS